MVQALQMPLLADQTAPIYGKHLIHTVGKLIAPVFNMHGGVCMRNVLTVHVSNSGHGFGFLGCRV